MGYNTDRIMRTARQKIWKFIKDMFNKKKEKVSYGIHSHLPSTVDDFLQVRDALAHSPQGGAFCFILALIQYASPDPNVHQEGVRMMVLSVLEENLIPDNGEGYGYKGYALHRSDIDRLARVSEYLARSYVHGTNNENHYTIPDLRNIKMKFRAQADFTGSVMEGRKKVFVWSSGADTARPMSLVKNAKGIWKVNEFSSVTVEIRPPIPVGPGAADVL